MGRRRGQALGGGGAVVDARVERMWSAEIAEQDVAAIGAECNGWLKIGRAHV